MDQENVKQTTADKAIMVNDKKYIPCSVPDWNMMAELVEQAKGKDRTMGKYAEDCGFSPATFTRIKKGEYKKPLSEDMIKSIVDNAASGSDVKMDSILRANGFLPEGEEIPIRPTFRELRRRNDEIQRVVTEGLEKRGYAVTRYGKRNKIEEVEVTGVFAEFEEQQSRRLTISVQGEAPKYRRLCVGMGAEPWRGRSDDMSEKELRWRDKRSFYHMLERYSFVFISDAMQPEAYKDVMYSFVIARESLYELFYKAMSDFRVNNYMSVILVDMDKEEVVKEQMIPRKDGKTLKSLFDKPILPEYDDNDDPFDDVF